MFLNLFFHAVFELIQVSLHNQPVNGFWPECALSINRILSVSEIV